MTRPRLSNFTSIFAIVFLCSAISAFAQRGGGAAGHGGTGQHSGGEGMRSGGGGGFRGAPSSPSHASAGNSQSMRSAPMQSDGGFRSGPSSPPREVPGYSQPMRSAPTRSAGEFSARPDGNAYRSSTNPGNGAQHMGNSFPAPRAVADGQFHSFGNAAEGRGTMASAPAVGRAPEGAGNGWHVFSGNRPGAGMHSTRSFSGQGNEVWENEAASRNAVSNARPAINVRGSLGNSAAANGELHSGASRSPNSQVASGPVSGNRVSPGSPVSNRAVSFGNDLRSGNLNFEHRGGARGGDRDGDRDGHRGGCWNCGFRGGFAFGWWPGWGFGWPWVGYSNWDPFYWNSMSWGWPGYDAYGYPARYPDGYDYNTSGDNSSYSAPDDSYTAPDSSSPPEAPSAQSSPQTSSVANDAEPVLLFMKDGMVYSARDYWFSDGQLHYVLTSGEEGAINAEQLDMQRTNDENTKRGVRFVVKSDPN